MKRSLSISIVSLIIAGLVFLAAPHTASAHPMGNFSINQYSAITVGTNRVQVQYIVDMAEIPTFQELGTIRDDHSSDLTAEQRAAYIAGKSAELSRGLSITLDGKPLTLARDKVLLSFPPGNGGLPTTRFELDLSASLAGAQRGTLEYKDGNYLDRVGWKEIIAVPSSGVKMENSSVPPTDISNRLTVYRPDAITSPPQVVGATLTFAPGPIASGTASSSQTESPPTGALGWAQQRSDPLADLLTRKEVPLALLLILAFGLGAGHALSPGHGKTVVAAYLVGSRGTGWHAVILGLTVTLSHTISVFLLGLIVLYASNYIVPETLYPWLSFISGMMVAALGTTLFVQRWRAWRAAKQLTNPEYRHDHHAHSHSHGDEHTHEHGHNHGHSHDHEHGGAHDHDFATTPHTHGLFGREHTHMPADGQRVTMGNLLALGIMGGIVPCPSALVVLLVAVSFHVIALGLALILAFSVGLAAVLTGIGLLMVYGRNLVSRIRFNGALLVRLPMVSALAVSCLGLLIAFQAFGLL